MNKPTPEDPHDKACFRYYAKCIKDGVNKSIIPYLLDKAVIHPAMPVLLSDKLVQLCEDINMSIWDRDKVYEALTKVKPRRE